MSGCSGGLCFHGAFNKKSDAERKKAKVGKKAFILSKWVGKGRRSHRYVVATRDDAVAFDFGFGSPAPRRSRRGKK